MFLDGAQRVDVELYRRFTALSLYRFIACRYSLHRCFGFTASSRDRRVTVLPACAPYKRQAAARSAPLSNVNS
ncbi:hypothetical protein ACILG0_17035 [Pseudomonadota bacterium AL_CKDN230030165-1A_HGKHYDSX7]